MCELEQEPGKKNAKAKNEIAASVSLESILGDLTARLEVLKEKVDGLRPENPAREWAKILLPVPLTLFAVWIGVLFAGEEKASEVLAEKQIESVIAVRNQADMTFKSLDEFFTTISASPDFKDTQYAIGAVTSAEDLRRSIVASSFRSGPRSKLLQFHEDLVNLWVELGEAETEDDRKDVAKKARQDIQKMEKDFLSIIDGLLL